MEPSGRFATKLVELADHKGMSLKDLAIKTNATYEHMRKLVKGLSYPSKYLLDVLVKALGADKEELQKLIAADEIERKYGKIPALLSGKNPEMTEVEKSGYLLLTAEHKRTVLDMISMLARQDRQAKSAGGKR
jgi:transcriptional regulator with XRE-family HTH domain